MTLDGRLDATRGRDAVEFTFTVTNAGTDPVTLSFDTGFLADVAVFDGDREVWRWSAGRAFVQVLGDATLAPGESFTHEATWPDPDPGRYTAVATLQATGTDVEARAEFSV